MNTNKIFTYTLQFYNFLCSSVRPHDKAYIFYKN